MSCSVPRSLRELPSAPVVALQLLDLMAKDDIDIAALTEVIGTDPVMCAHVLHGANAAAFARPHGLRSLQHAIVMIGLNRLRALVLAAALRTALSAKAPVPAFRRWWRHSLATAILSERLAGRARLRPDEAYAAGLVHDIGRLGLIASVTPAAYLAFERSLSREQADLCSRERECFGLDHCEAGEMLVTEWRLPPDIVGVVEHHHDDDLYCDDLIGLVRLSCAISSRLGFRAVRRPVRDGEQRLLSELPIWAAPEFSEGWRGVRETIQGTLSALEHGSA